MIKKTISFLSDIIIKRSVIYELAKRDFKQQNQGSYLGFTWMFLEPLFFVAVLYSVFSLGFRTGTSGEMPFILYLITGLISWLYFSGNFASTTGIILSYSFLIKNVDFRLSILPLVKILSGLPSHIFLIIVTIGLAWSKGYPPSLYSLQTLYYLFAMFMLLLGLGWLTSSTNLFVKDIQSITRIIIQFGFWLTPIFWNMTMIPEKYHWIVKLNPVCYIITGYRDSLVTHIGFWQRPKETLYYWGITAIILILGINVFRRLKPHFAEVL